MALLQLTESVKKLLKEAGSRLKGSDRRIFEAKTVNELGKGGQSKAERDLGWNRGTIRKGQQELAKGQVQRDRFSDRGRKKSEEHLPKLLEDIKAIMEPSSQADPTFRTTQLYTPLTAPEVRKRLIEDKGYTDEELPTVRTINTKMNDLNYRP